MFEELSDYFRNKLEERKRRAKVREREKTRKAKLKFKLEQRAEKDRKEREKDAIKAGWNIFRKDFGSEMCAMRTQETTSSCVSCVKFASQSRFLVMGSYDKTIAIWVPIKHKRGKKERWKRIKTLRGHQAEVIALDLSPRHSKFAASASWDMTVKVWCMPKDGELRQNTHRSGATSDIIGNEASGEVANAVSEEETNDLWHTFEGHTRRVLSVSFCSMGYLLASGDWGGNVRIWSMVKKEALHMLSSVHKGMIMSLHFSPNGSDYLATGASDQKVKLWKMKDSKLSKTYNPKEFKVLKGHLGTVCSLAFSPDAKVSSDKREIRVDGKREFKKFEIRTGKLLTACGDMRVRIFSLQTCECLYTLEEHSGWVLSVAWSPDGRAFASVDDDHNIVIWDAHTTQVLLSKDSGHTKIIQSVAFSDDSTLIATASWSGTTKLWMASGRKQYLRAWSARFEPKASSSPQSATDTATTRAAPVFNTKKEKELAVDKSVHYHVPRSHRRNVDFEIRGSAPGMSSNLTVHDKTHWPKSLNDRKLDPIVGANEGATTVDSSAEDVDAYMAEMASMPSPKTRRAPRHTNIVSGVSFRNRKHTKLLRMRPTVVRENFAKVESFEDL